MCPGAPLLIDGVADTIAGRQQPLAAACRLALSRLPDCDAVLLLSTGSPETTLAAGAGSRLLLPGSIITTTSIRRSDLAGEHRITLPSARNAPAGNAPAGNAPAGNAPVGNAPVGSAPVGSAPVGNATAGDAPAPNSTARSATAVGTVVGASLLAAVSNHAPVTALEILGDPAAAVAVLAKRTNSAERVAVVVIADGSACHGDDAPGRHDDRAAHFDAALAEALAAGAPDRLALACADRSLASDLLATVDPLAVLARLTVGRPPNSAELLYFGAPLGVGYLVASWRWTDS